MSGMIEPIVPVPEIFCSGLGRIEDMGGCLRFYLFVMQTPIDGGEPERMLVAKIVMPASAVPSAALEMLASMAAGSTAIDLAVVAGPKLN